MKSHAAIAAVCVRFAGLAMFSASLPSLGHTLGRILKQIWVNHDLSYIIPWIDYGPDNDPYTAIGWLALSLLGLYLLLGGRLVTRLLIRPLLANCQSCGYPLTSIKATRCPECGHDNPKRE